MPIKIDYYDEEKTKISARYVVNEKGEKDGLCEEYSYPDGKTLSSSVMYVAGKKEGVEKYFSPNGNVRATYTYVHGVEHGPFWSETEKEDSRRVVRGSYKKGKLDGEYSEYYSYTGGCWDTSWSGSSRENTVYRNGKIVSGCVEEDRRSSGTFHTSYRTSGKYYEKGRLVSEYAEGYNTDNGRWRRNIEYTYDKEGTHVECNETAEKGYARNKHTTYSLDAHGNKHGWYLETSSESDERTQYKHGKMDGLHICGTKISLYKDGLLVEGKVDYTSDNLIAKGRCKALGDCFFFSGTVKHLTSQGDWDLLTYKIGELEGPTYTTTYFDNGKKYIKEGINHKGLFSGIMTIMQGERIVQRESQVDGKREGLYEEFDAEGKLVEKMLYEKGKVVHDFFAEEKEAKRLAEEQAKKAEEERKIFIAERKKHVEALVFAKRSDAQARQETLKAVLAAKSRKEKLKILKKFHTEKANVVRFTALKFREIE